MRGRTRAGVMAIDRDRAIRNPIRNFRTQISSVQIKKSLFHNTLADGLLKSAHSGVGPEIRTQICHGLTKLVNQLEGAWGGLHWQGWSTFPQMRALLLAQALRRKYGPRQSKKPCCYIKGKSTVQ